MIAAQIVLRDDSTTITLVSDDDPTGPTTFTLPVGVISLGKRHILSDPPLPEELTNAIGEMIDHVDDAKRELEGLDSVSRVAITGPVASVVAAIEVGGRVESSEFVLSREAAEDVFRTIATESHADRRHNPGLPLEFVPTVVGGCCVIVGLIRGLRLDEVTVVQDIA